MSTTSEKNRRVVRRRALAAALVGTLGVALCVPAANAAPAPTAAGSATTALGAVAAAATPQEAVTADAQGVVVPDLDDVRGNITLPTAGALGSTLAWASSAPGVVTSSGEVTRPVHGADAVSVVLTVTATLDGATASATYTAVVQPMPEDEPMEGYFFPYFKGESTATGEEIYFGASQGNDPLSWIDLNDDDAVLTSDLGEKGLRDPFVIRSADGDRFYLLATDLKIYGGNDFGTAQESGSRSLMIWESDDLVHWSDQREVKVSSDYAGNTWAPEAYYDEAAGEYVVYWASALYPTTTTAGRDIATSYQRMMYATTRDFVTFSQPQVWVDQKRGNGLGMIDASVIEDDGTYYRFIKDEAYMIPRLEKSTSLRSTSWDLVKEKIGLGQPNPWGGTFTGGEGPTVFRSNTDPDKVYLFMDQPSYHGGQGYMAFESDDLASGTFTSIPSAKLPLSPRHGTVLPITASEHERLLQEYQPDALVTDVEDVAITVKTGSTPVLPATVVTHRGDGTTVDTAVTWDAIPAGATSAPGTFTLGGTLDAATDERATLTVTVTDADVAVTALSVTPATASVARGTTTTLTAKVTPANATSRTVTWTSSAPGVATVSATGVVTGVRSGTATITARTADGSRTASAAVTVTAEVSGLALRYEFEETSGTTVTDLSGHHNDGTYVRTPGRGVGVTGQSFAMTGGSSSSTTAPYVTIPNTVLQDRTSATVSTWVRWNASTTANQWVYALGTDSSKYLFSTPRNGSGKQRSAVTTGSYQVEKGVNAAAPLTGSTWVHLAVVLDGDTDTITSYLDGVKVGQDSTTITPADLYSSTKAVAGYIGKSFYAGDPYLNGAVDDFRIYDRALSAAELGVVAHPLPAQEAVDVTLTAQSRCVGTNAYVAVKAVNDEDVPVDVVVSTPFGEKTVAALAPGRSVSQTFNVRATSVAAGTAQVAATVSGGSRSDVVDASYGALSCAP